MPKTKQQEAQEKRLQRNIRQAEKTRADAAKGRNKTASYKPPKKAAFSPGLGRMPRRRPSRVFPTGKCIRMGSAG